MIVKSRLRSIMAATTLIVPGLVGMVQEATAQEPNKPIQAAAVQEQSEAEQEEKTVEAGDDPPLEETVTDDSPRIYWGITSRIKRRVEGGPDATQNPSWGNGFQIGINDFAASLFISKGIKNGRTFSIGGLIEYVARNDSNRYAAVGYNIVHLSQDKNRSLGENEEVASRNIAHLIVASYELRNATFHPRADLFLDLFDETPGGNLTLGIYEDVGPVVMSAQLLLNYKYFKDRGGVFDWIRVGPRKSFNLGGGLRLLTALEAVGAMVETDPGVYIFNVRPNFYVGITIGGANFTRQ